MLVEDEIKAMNELGTEAPGTSAPNTTAPGTISPATSGPTTDVPVIEEDKFEKLYQKIAELESKLQPVKKPSTTAPSTDAPVETQDFLVDINEDDLYEALSNKEKLNKILNAVYQSGVKTSRYQTTESVFRQMPGMIKQNVETFVVLTEATKQFYAQNEDLKPYAQQVAETFETIQSENADKTIGELFAMLGDKARTNLKLQQKVTTTPPNPKLPPGTSGRKGNAQSKPQLSGLMAEIEAMNTLED